MVFEKLEIEFKNTSIILQTNLIPSVCIHKNSKNV